MTQSATPSAAEAQVKPPAIRLHGLDTLRALAILAVMPFHLIRYFPEALRTPASFGWMGVDLFFVLSGFLIASQMLQPYLEGRTLDIPAFYARRAYRILPAYYTVLLLYVLVPAWRESPNLQAPWQFANFTENLLIDYAHNHAFSHAWSLCVEEHFYLVLPLLTVWVMRKPTRWKVYALLAAVLLFGIAARAYVLFGILRPLGPDSDNFAITFFEKLYYPTFVRLDGLLAGVALALLRTFRPGVWSRVARHGHLLTAAGLLTVSFAAWCTGTRTEEVYGKAVVGDLFGYPTLALGFALLTASALSQNGLLAQVRVPGAKLLATLAFGLYLTHKEAVHLLVTLCPKLPQGSYLAQPVYFAACLAVAGLLYVAVERPFLALRQRRALKSTGTAAVNLQARVDPAI